MTTPYIPLQWVNGTAPAINSTNLNHLEQGIKATTDSLIALETVVDDNKMPPGSILMFNGTVIPAGWALCNGLNGTPDLRGKFIWGGNGANNGNTGGYADAANIAHTHSAVSNGAHTHTEKIRALTTPINSYTGGPYALPSGSTITQNTSSAGSHTHTINSSGVSGVGRNLPPYYTLSYIMKLT